MKSRIDAIASALLLVALCALSLHETDAWLDGSEGRVLWDFRCDFQGQDLINQQAPSARCGDICGYVEGCTHWTWTTYLDGTCWLKQGAIGQVHASAVSNCGFVKALFKVDETSGFDLDTGVTAHSESDGLSADDAESVIQVLNFYRAAYGKAKLSLDARLVLAAKELVKTCPSQEQQQSDTNQRYTKTLRVPSAEKFGFREELYLLSVVTPSSMPVAQVLAAWGNVSDVSSTPLLGSNTTVVGYAKRASTSCIVDSRNEAASREASPLPTTTVWTVLLGFT